MTEFWKTEAGKAAAKKYRESPKGIEARQRYQAKKSGKTVTSKKKSAPASKKTTSYVGSKGVANDGSKWTVTLQKGDVLTIVNDENQTAKAVKIDTFKRSYTA